MAEEVIDAAGYRSREVFEAGRVFTLEPGDAIFSLPELMERTGGTERQVRDARESLKLAGFLDWFQPFKGGRARCVYRLSQWWRFIEPPKADASLEGDASTEIGSAKRQSRKADERPIRDASADRKGQAKVSQGTAKPSRSSRPNVQSAERRAATRAWVRGDNPDSTGARVIGPPHPTNGQEHIGQEDRAQSTERQELQETARKFGMTLEEMEEYLARLRLTGPEQVAILEAQYGKNGGGNA